MFGCISQLENLQCLSAEGITDICTAHQGMTLPTSLTALLLRGTDTDCDGSVVSQFGAPLRRLTALNCLEATLTVRTGVTHGASQSYIKSLKRRREEEAAGPTDVRQQFWDGMRAPLQELPLHLGASVDIRLIDGDTGQVYASSHEVMCP